MESSVYRFEIGELICYSISDGTIPLGAELLATFFHGSSQADRLRAYERHGIIPESYELDCNCLLIDSGAERILIDSGGGPFHNPHLGKLTSGLSLAGYEPEGIDKIVLTHGHQDHVCGGLNQDGSLIFSNARQLMARGEWDYWVEEADLDSFDDSVVDDIAFTRACLLAMRDQIDLIQAGDEVAPGIRTIATPGHTRNHLSIVVESGDHELICVGDTMDLPIHIEHTNWHPAWDELPETGMATRRKLLARAFEGGALIHGFHIPFPGLGHVRESGDGWRFEPIAISE